jgi:hypothetical protein
MANPEHYPRFPLYIPSKGRSEYMMTSKALTSMGVRHHVVVEPQEVERYRAAVQSMGLLADIVELDMGYKAKYELCDDLGLTKTTGSGPARNFIWDHAVATGHPWHWIMDDNIRIFQRMTKNEPFRCTSAAFWRAMEDFTLRYKNIAMAGPAYMIFCIKNNSPPFIKNTRIYSCNLIRNDIPFRWRGRYNEDTILSLDALKAGWCTVQFNAFIQHKMGTQTLKGGNTAELYKDGTMAKSQMLVRTHPDVSEVVWKFGRWHHSVNYRPFRRNQLILKDGITVGDAVDNYGMTVRKVSS